MTAIPARTARTARTAAVNAAANAEVGGSMVSTSSLWCATGATHRAARREQAIADERLSPPIGGLFISCAALLIAGGCGHETRRTAQTGDASVTFFAPGRVEEGGAAGGGAQAIAIEVPGFSAKLDVPGVSFGGAGFALDGMALAPGTRITGMRISGAAGDGSGGEGHGTVDAGFASPLPPAQLIAYYKRAAPAAGWAEAPPAAGQQFAATRRKAAGGEHLALSVGPQGTGSTGRFVVTGG